MTQERLNALKKIWRSVKVNKEFIAIVIGFISISFEFKTQVVTPIYNDVQLIHTTSSDLTAFHKEFSEYKINIRVQFDKLREDNGGRDAKVDQCLLDDAVLKNVCKIK